MAIRHVREHVSEIEQIVQSTISMIVNQDAFPADADPRQGRPAVTSAIGISGAWNGVVVVDMSTELARAAAANMFRGPTESIAELDLREVAAETANIVGGNLKGLFPGPSRLSLPQCLTDHEVAARTDGCERIEDVVLGCDAGDVRVRLFARQG